MANVLVTGASGFVGSHLCAALVRRGDQVRCLVRPTSSRDELEPLGVEFADGDVTDMASLEKACQDIDLVFHLAGVIKVRCADEFQSVNTRGTANVVAACEMQTTPPRLIYVSSIAAAGPVGRDEVRTETSPLAPVSKYGLSKRGGEMAVESSAECVPTTIVRPGIVIGPRDRLALDMFKPIATLGIHILPGWGSAKLSLIHVDDLVELLLRADQGETVPQNGDPAGEGYYFATYDEAPAYRDLGRMIAEAMGRNVFCLPTAYPLPWISAAVSQTAARMFGRPTAFNVDKIREASVASWACSSAKARQQFDLAWEYSLRERLEQVTAWYMDNGWLKIRFAPFRRK